MTEVSGIIEKFGMVAGQPQITISGKTYPMTVSSRGEAKAAGMELGDTVTVKVFSGTVTGIQRSTVPASQMPRQDTTTEVPPGRVEPGGLTPPVTITGLPSVQEIRHVQVPVPTLDDSIEIGTPGKGGVLKIRFNAARPEEADELIRSGFRRLQLARDLIDGNAKPHEEKTPVPLPERTPSRDEVVVAS